MRDKTLTELKKLRTAHLAAIDEIGATQDYLLKRYGDIKENLAKINRYIDDKEGQKERDNWYNEQSN